MLNLIVRIILGSFCVLLALLMSGDNNAAAAIWAILAGVALWPLLRGGK